MDSSFIDKWTDGSCWIKDDNGRLSLPDGVLITSWLKLLFIFIVIKLSLLFQFKLSIDYWLLMIFDWDKHVIFLNFECFFLLALITQILSRLLKWYNLSPSFLPCQWAFEPRQVPLPTGLLPERFQCSFSAVSVQFFGNGYCEELADVFQWLSNDNFNFEIV